MNPIVLPNDSLIVSHLSSSSIRFVTSIFLCHRSSSTLSRLSTPLGADVDPPITPLPDEESGTISRSSMTDKPSEEKKMPVGCGNRQKSLITKQMLEELAALPADDDDDGGLLLPAGVK